MTTKLLHKLSGGDARSIGLANEVVQEVLDAPVPPAVRWHLIQMAARLPLTKAEQRRLVTLLQRHLSDNSSIVKTSAMQALADLADDDQRLRTEVMPLLEEATLKGTAAMRSRGIKLLKRLKT